MAVKDYQVKANVKAIVVDGNGRVYKMDNLSKRVQNAKVIGEDTFNNEMGEPILHIWID